MFSSQGERTFSEEEEQKLQAALSLDKQALSLVVETAAFILEQVRGVIWRYYNCFTSFVMFCIWYLYSNWKCKFCKCAIGFCMRSFCFLRIFNIFKETVFGFRHDVEEVKYWKVLYWDFYWLGSAKEEIDWV